MTPGPESVRNLILENEKNKIITTNPAADVAAGPAFPIERREQVMEAFDRENAQCLPDAAVEIQGLMNNALLLIDNGEYQLARNILRRILETDSYHVEAIRWLGYCFSRDGDLVNAVRCFSVIARLRGDAESHVFLAEALYKNGEFSKALNAYENALGLIDFESPYLFEIYKNMGNIFLKNGDFDAAEENYNRAYTISPHSDALLVNFGTLCIQKNDHDQAMERFRDAIDLNQCNDKAWVGLSLVYRDRGDLELAWGALEKALDIESANLTALQLTVDWGLKDLKLHIPLRRLREYLNENPHDANLSYALAGLLFTLGRLEEAGLETERVLGLDPSRADAVELRGLVRKRLESSYHG